MALVFTSLPFISVMIMSLLYSFILSNICDTSFVSQSLPLTLLFLAVKFLFSRESGDRHTHTEIPALIALELLSLKKLPMRWKILRFALSLNANICPLNFL